MTDLTSDEGSFPSSQRAKLGERVNAAKEWIDLVACGRREWDSNADDFYPNEPEIETIRQALTEREEFLACIRDLNKDLKELRYEYRYINPSDAQVKHAAIIATARKETP